MRVIHFFKARSRIGIINNPYNQTESNLGVEIGADLILDNSFLSEFKNYYLSVFNFPSPESISKEEYFAVLSEQLIYFKDFINSELTKKEKQIVVGGDHCISLSSVMALIDRVKDVNKIGYIHFDSHGDINLFKDSPSGNFHGMYLRPLFDIFDIPLIDNLVPNKVPTENLLIVGNLDLDKEEKDFIKSKNIKLISRNDLLLSNEKTLQLFKTFVNNFEYLHVSFDGDVLDRSIFPATGIPVENGFMLKEIISLIKIIAFHPNISFDIAEFNPKKNGVIESAGIVRKILKYVI